MQLTSLLLVTLASTISLVDAALVPRPPSTPDRLELHR